MKLYIHDKCMEQLFELPRITQRKVLEFQKKFRENSKSSAIHLEPINTFKDQSLRTARVDDKYRAIIKVPQTGDEYYLLWVDNHDQAMDWARNKLFHWNDHTQTAQIFTAPEQEIIPEQKVDISDPKLFDAYTDEQLINIGVPQVSLPLVRSIQDLNEFEKAEKYLPSDAYENLFYLSDGANYEFILAEINEGKTKLEDHASQVESLNNKRNFVEVDDDLISAIINGDLSKWQIFLHPSQRKLVESDFKGSVKVTGGAGTGKTVVALHRLKHLSSALNGTDKKIVFTTFTNALTVNLNKLASRLSIDESKALITNIDSLARDLGKEYGIIDKSTRILDTYNSIGSSELWEKLLEQNLSEFEPSFLYAEYQNVILLNNVKTKEEYLITSRTGRGKPITRKQRMEIWSLLELYNKQKQKEGFIDRAELFNEVTNYLKQLGEKPFAHVIADEVQDLSNVELRFLRSLTEEMQNDIFLVGDPFQKIYARKINFTSSGISVRGNRSKQLRINYRTSEEIKRLALSAIKGVSYDDFDGEAENLNGYLSLFHGSVPTYHVYKTKNEELEAITSTIKELLESGIQYNEIAISCRLKDSLKEIKIHLHKVKIAYYDITSNSGKNEGVFLSTFHSIKGLEFKAVILADINNRTLPLYVKRLDQMEEAEKLEYLQSERSLLYVAISRAIHILKMVGTGIKSDMCSI